MPELDAFHGGASAALARSARLLARENDFMSQQTDALWGSLRRGEGLDYAGLKALHPALQLRLLRRLLPDSLRHVSALQLESFLRWKPREGGRLSLSGGCSLVCRSGVVQIEPVAG